MSEMSSRVLLPELSRRIVGCFYEVCNELGAGFAERVYSRSLVVALQQRGISCRSEVPVDVLFRGVNVGEYRIDLLVEDKIVLECKAGAALAAEHQAQLINYLRISERPLGLLLHFGAKPTFKHLALTHTRS